LLTADREVYRVVNLYEQIYKKAVYRYLSSGNESVQLGSLRIMLEVTKQLHEILVLPELMERLRNLEEKAKKGVFVR